MLLPLYRANVKRTIVSFIAETLIAKCKRFTAPMSIAYSRDISHI